MITINSATPGAPILNDLQSRVGGEASPQRSNEAKQKRDWRAIRAEYETSVIGLRPLAQKCNVPFSTIAKRSMREKWRQRADIVRKAARDLETAATEQAQLIVRDELAPLIEAKRAEITKRGYHVASKGLDRLEQLWDRLKPDNTKEECDGARTAETLVRLARTSLGMNDGTQVGGPLTVNVLSNHAAIQVVSQP